MCWYLKIHIVFLVAEQIFKKSDMPFLNKSVFDIFGQYVVNIRQHLINIQSSAIDYQLLASSY